LAVVAGAMLLPHADLRANHHRAWSDLLSGRVHFAWQRLANAPSVLFVGRGDMERSEAIAKLKQNEAELRRLGVEHLYLFGSTARGEASEDSDVDLFFDHPEGSLGLFELMDVKDAAARILGRKTDIMTRRSLHPVLRQQIEASALQIF
jgi:predicted nucleotidyltransferase